MPQTLPDIELNLLMAAVESAGEAVVITDLDARITYSNPAFERITGWPRDVVLGKNPRILNSGLNPPEQFEDLWRTITAGRTWRGSLVNRRRDGSLYDVEQTIAPVCEGDEPVAYVSVHRDVTNQNRVQQDLRQATEDRLRLAEDQIQLARTIQQKLYPSQPPEIPGFEIAGATFPAEATCGDYFDYLTFSDGSPGIVVGDVSGHGLGPAMLMTETRAFLRALCEVHCQPDEILARLNDFLVEDTAPHQFVSLFLCLIDPDNSSLTCAAAGHAGYLIHDDGSVESLDSTGLVLGLVRGATFETSPEIKMHRGDQLVLATDGFCETSCPERELWGHEGLLDSVKAHRSILPVAAIDAVYQDARSFGASQPQADDMTMVLMRACSQT